MANSDDRERKQLIDDEKRSYDGHLKRLKRFQGLQILAVIVGAVSSAIIAFAQTDTSHSTIASSPGVLFACAILTALAAVAPSLGLTRTIADQMSRANFHRTILGQLRVGLPTQAAKDLINEYFQKQRRQPG